MNVVTCIVLLNIFFNAVKGINRIPVSYRAHSYESDESQDLGSFTGHDEIDDDNPQIKRELNILESKETKMDLIDKVNMSTISKREVKFTDFILEAAKLLKTFKNNVLEQVFAVIDDEVWKDMYKGCKSQELSDIKKYASDQLGVLKDAPAETLRQHLDYIIEILTNEDYGEGSDLVDYINSLYVEDGEKFIEILLSLMHRKISDDEDLADILKDALQSLIFDHYCNLDKNLRHELVKLIKHFWKQFVSQIINDKSGSNKGNKVPFVTPFIKVDDHKKRRFNKVNNERPLVKRWKSAENVGTSENITISMRTNSGETWRGNEKSAESEDKKEVAADKNGVKGVNSNKEHKGSGNAKSNLLNRSNLARFTRIRADQTTTAKLKSTAWNSELPNNLQHSSNTIDRLINIGELAKEINDMIGPEDNALRQKAFPMCLDALLGMQFLGFADANGSPTPETVQINEENKQKDVIISMKAKYQE